MFAEKGEKLDARAAARMIIRFWPVVKTEYFSCLRGRRGVVSVGSSCSCILSSRLLGGLDIVDCLIDSRISEGLSCLPALSQDRRDGTTRHQGRYKLGVF